MSTHLYGRLFYANGSPTNFGKTYTLEYQDTDDVNTSHVAVVTFAGADIVVQLQSWPATYDLDLDEFVTTARNLVDAVLYGELLQHGRGIGYCIQSVRKASGEVAYPSCDWLATGEFAVSASDVQAAENAFPPLRFALADVNQGLMNREFAPLLWYRAIETAGRALMGTPLKLDWPELHSHLGTSRKLMSKLEEVNTPHRHGNTVPFTSADHAEMRLAIVTMLSSIIRAMVRQRSGK